MIRFTTVCFVLALSTLALIHILALRLYLYWYYVWLDVPVHFLGGIVVAFGVYAARDLRLPYFSYLSATLTCVMVIVVLVMLAWEVFELWAGIPRLDNFVFDTSLDIIAGFLGGITGALIARRLSTVY